MRTECRRGHDLTLPHSTVKYGDEERCRRCRQESNSRAVSRYRGTSKGMLTRVRAHAKERGRR